MFIILGAVSSINQFLTNGRRRSQESAPLLPQGDEHDPGTASPGQGEKVRLSPMLVPICVWFLVSIPFWFPICHWFIIYAPHFGILLFWAHRLCIVIGTLIAPWLNHCFPLVSGTLLPPAWRLHSSFDALPFLARRLCPLIGSPWLTWLKYYTPFWYPILSGP